MDNSFTLTLRSRDRTVGNTNAYSLQLPALPKGCFKATLTLQSNQTDTTELTLNWPGCVNHLSSRRGEANVVALVFDLYTATGTLLFQDPGSSVDINCFDLITGAVCTNMAEHTICAYFEAL